MLSANDVAAKVGCSARTARRIAARLKIGTLVGTSLVFKAGDVAKIAAEYRGKAGNPNMTEGNYFAGAKNKSS
jgi:hypothetical protein